VYTHGPLDIVMDDMDRVGRFGIGADHSDRRAALFRRLNNSDLTPLTRPAASGHNGQLLAPSSSGYRKHGIEETAFIPCKTDRANYYQRSVINDHIPNRSVVNLFFIFFCADFAERRTVKGEQPSVA
jgi:hypothetical protein